MKKGRHIIFDAWQRKWLALASMPTGDPRITVTRWTHDREKAFAFQSLQAARNMAEALGGGDQFEIHRRD